MIKWEGYSSKYNSWEPIQNVSSDLIAEYEENNSNENSDDDEIVNENEKSFTNKVYEVDKIINSRKTKKGNIEFYIKWKGWVSKYNSWEPENNVSDDLIKEFDQNMDNATNKTTFEDNLERVDEDINVSDTINLPRNSNHHDSFISEEIGRDKNVAINRLQDQIRVIKMRFCSPNKAQYLVKWKESDKNEDTWEEEPNVNNDLLNEYKNENKTEIFKFASFLRNCDSF